MGSGRVIGVVGARGGIGASSLAASLAQRLAAGSSRRGRGARRGDRAGFGARRGPGDAVSVALADLDGAGGGLDVLLGLEGIDGLRWPDLHGARGEVSGAELTALLPRWSGVTVLSADRIRPGEPRAEVLADVLDALVASHDVVVLDLDRRGVLGGGGEPDGGADGAVRGAGGSSGAGGVGPGGGSPLERCEVVLVLAGRDLRSVAGVLALREAALAAAPDVRLVVRGPAPGGLGVLELAHVVDLPVAATMAPQRGFDAALERGAGPAPRRGPLARAADRLAIGLG